MKILHLLSQRPEMTGSGVYINQMIKQASNSGFENALLAGVPVDDEAKTVNGVEQLFPVYFGENGDIPFPVTGMSDVMPYPSSRFRDLDASALALYEEVMEEKLRLAVDMFKPEIIHANHLWFLTALAKRLFPDIPVVASCHGSDIRQYRINTHFRDSIVSECKKLDAVFALSPAQAEEISDLYSICPSKVHVTGAGYDQSLFKTREKKDKQSLNVLYAGKLANAKGLPWLLEAFRKVSGTNITLHLCGSGSGVEAEAIRSKAALDARVIMYGNVSQQMLASMMQASDVFVLPSFFEGLPLVLLEAMACGCRLVTTRLPGVEYVFGETGENVSIIDLPELINIDQPLKEGEERFVKQLADAIVKQLSYCHSNQSTDIPDQENITLSTFTWESVFQRVNRVYRQFTDSL